MAPTRKPKRDRRPIYLREWRKHNHLTQEQLASRIGIDATTLGRIENGILPYNQDLIEIAAEALGCEPADILMRNPSLPASPWSILDSLKKAAPNKQAEIQAVVETMLKTGS